MKNKIKLFLTLWVIFFTFLNVNAQCETIMKFFKDDIYTSKDLVGFAEKDPQKAFDSWKLLYNEKTGLTKNIEDLNLVSKNLDEIKSAGRYLKWKNLNGAGNLLNAEGKFIDNLLETDYAKYLTRKATQGKTPRGRLDWKEARDCWLLESPMARGNAFNLKAQQNQWYDFFEINLENGKRLDSYVPPNSSNGNIGEIISRKATNLEEIELSTFETYLKEMQSKYSAGTKIRSNKYPALDGQTLQGKQILEIPSSNQSYSQIQDYIDLAKNKYSIELRFRPE